MTEVSGIDRELLAATEPYREARARAWERRAQVVPPDARQWYEARARGLRRRPDTVAACGTVVASVGACARDHAHGMRAAYARCGDRHACPHCARRASRRAYARIRASVDAAIAAAAHGRGRARGILRLLTLTVRHSGDLRADRERIQRAWHRHRSWLRKCARQQPRYWAVWECTPGADGRGHVHLHVLLLAGRYSYRRAHAAWCAHADGGSARYDARTVRDARAGAGAIAYLAGYLSSASKRAEWLEQAPPAMRAAWWDACYGRRAVSAHRGAWPPAPRATCPCCASDMVWVRPVRPDSAEESMAYLARALAAADVSRETLDGVDHASVAAFVAWRPPRSPAT